MITRKLKILWVKEKPYLVSMRRPLINEVVVELLNNGEFDLFQIDTLNDIDTHTQFPIIVKPEELGYHWIKGYVMHDHVVEFYENGTIEEIYDMYNTLSKIEECKIIMDGQNDIMKRNDKVIIIL